jgi:hypothetical protein
MRGMVQMTLRSVCMMGRLLMVPGFVVVGGFAMMPSRVLVVFCGFAVMFCSLLGHESSSSSLGHFQASGPELTEGMVCPDDERGVSRI